jgi:transposase
VDDRRVISGILHVLKTGCRWRDVPSAYGPPTTIYNRFTR